MFRAVTLAIALAIAGPAFAFGTFGNPSGYGYQGGGRYVAPPTVNTYPNGLGGFRMQGGGSPTVNCYSNGLGGMRCN